MAKKNFTQKDAESVDTVEALRNEQRAEQKKEAKKQKTVTPKVNPDTPECRFTARFNEKEWEYLTEYHWQKRIAITDILRRLVQEDMKKHPEIMETVDELNAKNPSKSLM